MRYSIRDGRASLSRVDRCMVWLCRAVVAFSLLSAARHVAAQKPEYQGLAGSVAVARTSYSISDTAAPVHGALRLELGYRLRLPGKVGKIVTVTPLFSLGVTHIAGISIGSRQVALAQIDKGIQLTARSRLARPYVVLRSGTRTMERMEDGYPINYTGSGKGFGGGVEIPMSRTGRGFDISATHVRGTFTERQRLKYDLRTVSLPYSGWVLAFGWSGKFRGTSLIGQ
jgi:hypothetical protein